MRDLIVIIPVFNAEKNISQIVSELHFAIPWAHYVVVDDGSTDRTAKICKEKGYHVISHSNNYGIETAAETGYKFALQHGYEYIIRFDGSGFYSAKDIQKFVDEFKNQTDIVLGSKFSKDIKLNFGEKLESKIIQLENNKKLIALRTGFSGIRTRIARDIITSCNKTLTTSFISEKIKDGYIVKEIPVFYSQTCKGQYYKTTTLFSVLSHIFVHKILRKRGR